MERQIEVHAPIVSDARAVSEVVKSDPGALFASPGTTRSAASRSVSSSIELAVGDGAAVRHGISVTIGRVIHDAGDVVVPVHWEPVGHDRVLPSFEGALVVRPAPPERSVTLSGSYTAPLGPVGRFGDRLVGHRVARQSLQTLVDEIAERLDREVTRRWTKDVTAPRPPAYNADLRDRQGTA